LKAADWIYVLDGGRVSAEGTHASLVAAAEPLAMFPQISEDDDSDDSDADDVAADADKLNGAATGGEKSANGEKNGDIDGDAVDDGKKGDAAAQTGELIKKEAMSVGGIPTAVYIYYAKQMGGLFFALTLVACYMFSTTGLIMADWWLSAWTSLRFGERSLEFYSRCCGSPAFLLMHGADFISCCA
jgi:hypothetical protein